jgi:peptidoglycan/xylan/chitin deacetylase (PgdA/CDA1 family)
VGINSRLFKYYFPDIFAKTAIRSFSPYSGIVLMYHEVLPDDVALPAWTIVKESDFRWQLNFLKIYFDFVSIDQALERIDRKHNAKRPFAVVTFDDGYKGNFNTVLPIMETLGLPFIVYIATKAIVEEELYWYDRIINLLNIRENLQVKLIWNHQLKTLTIPKNGEDCRWLQVQKILNLLKIMAPEDREQAVSNIVDKHSVNVSSFGMMNEDEMRQLSYSNCVTIGCHTHGHELLDQLDARAVRETLNIAYGYIKSITGYSPRHFAYPNGNFNNCIINLVRDAGYDSAVTTLPGILSDRNCRMRIPRLSIGRFETKSQFKARVLRFL